MGVRFRKSVKIMPGVRVNISKSGLSTTIGPKGASINIGKNGAYLNVGIPRTGVYTREKISGKTKSASTSSSGSHYDPEFSRRYELYKPISLKLNGSGKIEIIDKDGKVITDEYFLKKMRGTEAYKSQKEQIVALWREKCEELYQNAQNSLSELVNIHRYSFDVKPLQAYEQMLTDIKPLRYKPREFTEKEPVREEIEKSLAKYAELHVTTKAFWRIKKLREEYVQENLEPQYQKQHGEWEKAKRDFEQKQQQEAERMNAAYTADYEAKCNAVRERIAGSDEYVKTHLEEWLSTSTLPVEVNVDYEYEADTGNMYIDLLLPSEDIIPQEEIIKLANGGVKGKAKTHTVIQTEYAQMIFGLAICITSGVFDISPAIKRVLTSGFATRRNKEGDPEKECLYSIKFTREGFENASVRREIPFAFINRFENRLRVTQTWSFKAVTPFDDF